MLCPAHTSLQLSQRCWVLSMSMAEWARPQPPHLHCFPGPGAGGSSNGALHTALDCGCCRGPTPRWPLPGPVTAWAGPVPARSMPHALQPTEPPGLSPCCASPGLLALLGLSIYTGVTVNVFAKRYEDWRFSWSYILGWVGVILTISAGNPPLRLHLMLPGEGDLGCWGMRGSGAQKRGAGRTPLARPVQAPTRASSQSWHRYHGSKVLQGVPGEGKLQGSCPLPQPDLSSLPRCVPHLRLLQGLIRGQLCRGQQLRSPMPG